MKTAINLTGKSGIWTDSHGQDLLEYALMAGILALSAGVIVLGVASSISRIFSMVAGVVAAAS
jgi:pilus assembly protein Flp/PilA